jgi:tripartite-type tricarboxylate transporter receptor subunit TctC
MRVTVGTTVRALVAVVLLAHAASAGAQGVYPSKAIRIITPYSAGGTTDILSRMIGPKLTESWGQPVIVDNRPGGSTVIGSEAMVKSPPDGYTLLCILTSHAIVPNLVPTPYDAIRDFAAVATISSSALLATTHPSVPVRTLKELIAFAKSRPGQLNYASGGSGTVTQLAGEYFNILAGVRTQHIPYKGSAPAITALLGGEVHFYFSPPIVAMPYLKTGRLRALAFTGEARLPALPLVPTAVEAGLKGFEVTTWYGLLAPSATPRAIIDKLNAEMAKMLALPDIRERLTSQGMEPFITTPDQFAALIKADLAKYARVIKSANIKLEQ